MELTRIETPPELDMPLGEAMFTQRAIRRLDPNRPISDAHLKIILDAASKAPSGGNTQPARFLVIRNEDRITRIREALPRSLVGETPGRVRVDGQGRHSTELRLSNAVTARRRDRGCSGDRPRAVGWRKADGSFGISARTEPAACGACAWDRIGAHDVASTGDGARVRDVRDPQRGRVSLLYSLGVSKGGIRADEKISNVGDD